MAEQEEKKLPKLIWIDKSVNEGENKRYQKELYDIKLFDYKVFESIEEGINEIKKISFEKIYLIIRGTMFQDFLTVFKEEKKKISCSLDILIFTSKKHKYLVEDISEKDKDISSGFLFNNKKIFITFKELREYLKGTHNINISEIEEQEEIFEKIENYEQLILPIYYQKLIEPIKIEEINDFNNYLMNFYGEKMKSLISQLDNISQMPYEIICKYWMRAYTLETGFYNEVKAKLQQKKGNFLLPYIKMLYEGIKNKTFQSVYDKKLYRGAVISNHELKKLKTYLDSKEDNNKDINIPKVITYFKPYQSYSIKKEVAIKFMNKAKKKNNFTKVIFKINKRENVLEEELFSNAYIKDFSRYKTEDEVLFFPYSCFGIEKIKEKENYVNIYLDYLGKYRPYIESKKPKELLFNNIPMTQFAKDLLDLGLIKYNFKKYWEVVKSFKVEGGNCTALLCLNNKILLLAVNKILRIYDLQNDKIIQNINIHTDDINNITKISENKIISSSKDKTINIIELINNYFRYNLIKSINIHKDSVNQTISLKCMNNTYASCSKDETIKIFKLENDNISILKNLEGHESEIISIFELPNNEIISFSQLGFLKFWNYENCIKTLGIHESPLYNNINIVNDNIISIGTNKSIIFIDFIKKEIFKKYKFDFISSSICNFFGNIIFGTKKKENLCYIKEYQILDNNYEIEIEFVGKGKDNDLDISSLQTIDENSIVSSNKNNYIKIWRKTDVKPEYHNIENINKISFLQKEIDNKDNIIKILTYENENLKNDKKILENNLYNLNNNIGNVYNKKIGKEIKVIFDLAGKRETIYAFENEIVADVVKKIFKDVPNFDINNYIFYANGQLIDKNKSLEENNIKDNNAILLVKYQK